MQDEGQSTDAARHADRLNLLRDIVVLQFKLVVDGLRDLILVPVSLVVGLFSLLRGGDESGSEFYDLLRLGRKSERWINLFGAVDRAHGAGPYNDDSRVNDFDDMVTRVESFLVEEYKSGGVTRQAKDRLDMAIETLHERVRRRRSDNAG
jgi:hypothetical protein